MHVNLDVTGGTLAHFTDALTAAGIAWTAGTGPYELQLLLNPSLSGGSYFAWDLSAIDPAMSIQGIQIANLVAVPEPASAALGFIALTLLPRRRRG